MIKKIGGWGNFILLCLLLLGLTYGLVKKLTIINNPSYALGISEGIKKESKGTLMLHYRFTADGVGYKGSVPESFCRKCNDCCSIGDLVQVRYETGNPDNNDLVTSIPGE